MVTFFVASCQTGGTKPKIGCCSFTPCSIQPRTATGLSSLWLSVCTLPSSRANAPVRVFLSLGLYNKHRLAGRPAGVGNWPCGCCLCCKLPLSATVYYRCLSVSNSSVVRSTRLCLSSWLYSAERLVQHRPTSQGSWGDYSCSPSSPPTESASRYFSGKC